MNTLHKNSSLFNTKLSISHNDSCLSNDAGLILAKQFIYLLDFEKLSDQ